MHSAVRESTPALKCSLVLIDWGPRGPPVRFADLSEPVPTEVTNIITKIQRLSHRALSTLKHTPRERHRAPQPDT